MTTLTEHLGRVRVVAATNTHVFSGSDDHSIKIWEIASGQCIATILGNKHRICHLQATETRLVCAAYDDKFTVYDFAAIPSRNTFEKSLAAKQSVVPISRQPQPQPQPQPQSQAQPQPQPQTQPQPVPQQLTPPQQTAQVPTIPPIPPPVPPPPSMPPPSMPPPPARR